MQRKLAAILAADVAGDSRLMERDEAGTFERLRAHCKELFEPAVRARGHLAASHIAGILCHSLASAKSERCRTFVVAMTISSARDRR